MSRSAASSSAVRVSELSAPIRRDEAIPVPTSSGRRAGDRRRPERSTPQEASGGGVEPGGEQGGGGIEPGHAEEAVTQAERPHARHHHTGLAQSPAVGLGLV